MNRVTKNRANKAAGSQRPLKISIALRKRILLVEDHPLMREGIANWLQHARELEIVGHASSAETAVSAVETLKPDLVLTDISLPGRSGLELVKDLRVTQPKLPVVVFSMHDESLYARRSLCAGARGYIMKSAGGEQLVNCLRRVLAGEMCYSPELATRLLEEYSGGRKNSDSPLPELSDRELEILQLLGEVRTTREISMQLHISAKTVETHRANIKRKLKLNNSVALLRFAVQYAERVATPLNGA